MSTYIDGPLVSAQPFSWAAIYVVSPPLMAPDDSGEAPIQICKVCRDSFNNWFKGGKLR